MFTSNDFQSDPSVGGLYVKPRLKTTDVLVRDESGRLLYCVIGLHGTASKPLFEGPLYFSASDQASAEFQFRRRFWHLHFVQVLAAPAVGFYVHDNHGDLLSAGGERPKASALDRGTAYEKAA